VALFVTAPIDSDAYPCLCVSEFQTFLVNEIELEIYEQLNNAHIRET
jgi:hypothetical protein